MLYKQFILINVFSSISLTSTIYISYLSHIYIEIILFLWKLSIELYYKRLTYDLYIHHFLFIFSTYYTILIKPEYLFLLSISQIIHLPLIFYYLYKETNDLRSILKHINISGP